MLTLAYALKRGRLEEFIAQEEARGVGPADMAKLDALLRTASRPQQSEDRTSHSRGRGGSTGK